MLKSKGLLLFDYDGTLVDGSIGIHEMSEKTVEALTKARENGYLTVLSSGRSVCLVEKVKHLFDGFITTNGAYAVIKGVEYHNIVMDPEILKKAVDFFEKNKEHIYANIENQEYAYGIDIGTPLYEWNMRYFGLDRSKFIQWEGQYETGCNKITVMYDKREIYEALEAILGVELEVIDHPLENYAEIMSPGCTKGSALKAILEKTGMPVEKVYAFGDSENDYTMLKEAGHAIIMGKHSPMVEEVADFVTLRVEEEGICHALKHFGII
ncbi:MAG: HAD family hydrolase [Lachnospiraceae bacterium]|nr:HAD family hydrolase [Lachnospiraceae bacterium]